MLINFSILQHNAWYTLQKCLSFQYEPGRRLPVQSQQLEHVGNMFTVNNEDTYSCAWVANFEQVVSWWDGWYHKKPLKTNFFLPFNFSVSNICVAIRLAEDGTRMGGI